MLCKAYLIPVRKAELQHLGELRYFNIQYYSLGKQILNDWQNKLVTFLSSSHFYSLDQCVWLSDLQNMHIHPVQHVFFCLSCSHFYKPLLRRGFSKMISQSAVFFLSAFFHEVRVEIDTTFSAYVDAVDNSQCTVKCANRWVSVPMEARYLYQMMFWPIYHIWWAQWQVTPFCSSQDTTLPLMAPVVW